MFSLRRAIARTLSKPSIFSIPKPRSITSLASSSLRTTRPSQIFLSQKRFASDDPNERHPALEEKDAALDQSLEEAQRSAQAEEPVQPEATSAEAFDMSDIQPTDAREVPQPEPPSATQASESEPAFKAFVSGQGLGETFNSSMADSTGADTGAGAAAEAEELKQLYVGNLYFDVTEQDLRREFSKHGTVSQVKIVYDARGLSKGFGYVDFLSRPDAEAALTALDRQVYEGRRISVQWANQRANRSGPRAGGGKNTPSKTLFIGNMSFELSDQDLNDLFRDIKNVLDVRVAIDRRTGQPRGFAHADFTDVQSAEMAMQKLEGKELYGRSLRVDFSAPSARVRAVH